MSRAGPYAYLHGKLHGIVAKSFLESRFQTLLRLTNLSDVYRALFPGEALEISEKDLVRKIERKYEQKNLMSFIRTLDVFPNPPSLLIHALRRFEIRNVKSILRSIHTGLPLGELWDLEKYGTIPLPVKDPDTSLESTPYAALVPELKAHPLWEVEYRLDEEYYERLWEELESANSTEKNILRPAFITEIRLLDILSALRLRYYYRIDEEEVKERLFLKGKTNLAKDIQALYQLPLEEGSSWQNWKYGWMVTTSQDGKLDPSPASWRVSKRLYLLYRRMFYHHPFTLSSIYGFFRMKEYEVRLIHTLTEGMQLGMPDTAIRELVEGL
ncbi:MAG: hypothetical protein Kow009_03590 [Spirochaetales bacterium]